MEEEDGKTAQVQIGFIAKRARPTHIAELERVDEMKPGVQRGEKLDGGGEVAVELLDEKHHVNGDGGVERGGELGELVVHLHRTEIESERSRPP